MKERSIFIDESGDFGDLQERPAYYLDTFVFHSQDKSIVEDVHSHEQEMKDFDFNIEYIHTGAGYQTGRGV